MSYRNRLEFPELRRKILSLAAEYNPTAVLIEDAGTGAPLIQQLQRERKLRPTLRASTPLSFISFPV